MNDKIREQSGVWNSTILYLPRDKNKVIKYLANDDFTCPKEQIMHKKPSLACTLPISYINS